MATTLRTRGARIISTGAACSGMIPVADIAGKIDVSWLPNTSPPLQSGSASAPIPGVAGHATGVTVTFPIPYASNIGLRVFPILRQSQICSAGLPGVIVVTGITTTDFTVKIDTNDDDSSAGFNINVAPNFDWLAVFQP